MNQATRLQKNHEPKTVLTVTRVASRLFDESPFSRSQIQFIAGLGRSTIAQWSSGSRKASVNSLDKALRVIGYRLTIEKIPTKEQKK